uniref:Retrovirus-related Pol polyprotein from transposon TNT 1-94-like beta-barrel domain-containing protein n=1 Tax=Chenopodium quinoa TaxID=63459 RepID=A0A803MGW1_CHEQI
MPENFSQPTQDPTRPYYIHPSENTSQSLISEKFSGEGYGEWKRTWKRCDAIIISYVLRSLDNSISRSVLYLTSSREIWKDLEDRYSQTSCPQLYTLQQKLADISQARTEGDVIKLMVDAVENIKLWDQISEMNPLPICSCNGCTCGLTQKFLKQQQEERLVQLLMKLNNKYANTRSNILMMQPLPPISLAYRLLIQEEKQREMSSLADETSKVMVFTANSHKYQSYPKYHQQNAGNSHKFVVHNKKLGIPLFSDYCKFPGHIVDKCFKIVGYPPNHPSKFKVKRIAALVQGDDESQEADTDDAQVTHISQEHYNNFLRYMQTQEFDASSGGSLAQTESGAYIAGTCLITCSNSRWIIDSGATDHICSNIDLFTELRHFDKFPNTITIADGKKVVVNHIGTIKFENGIQLDNVLHVPGFKFNLISTHKLCKDLNYEVTFTHDKCLIQDPISNQCLVLANLNSRLYDVDEVNQGKEQDNSGGAAVSLQSCLEEAKLWHLRLGHLPFNKLHLVNNNFVCTMVVTLYARL